MKDQTNVDKTASENVDKIHKQNDIDITDLYPTRRGAKPEFNALERYAAAEKYMRSNNAKCQLNVYNAVKKSPIIHVLMRALQNSGCDFDIGRNISCEVCSPNIAGGYDALYNQIVVCQNRGSSKGVVQTVLAHEMIHAFDHCRHHMSDKNIRHVACTEIRAANLAHCSFMSSMLRGCSALWRIQKTHQNCVKHLALKSIMAGRTISEEEAMKVIEDVFPACYNDLEPIGRRIRRNSEDQRRAYIESSFYGYQ